MGQATINFAQATIMTNQSRRYQVNTSSTGLRVLVDSGLISFRRLLAPWSLALSREVTTLRRCEEALATDAPSVPSLPRAEW